RVIAIGVDTTGSTPLPVDAANRPLALDPRWRDSLAAHAWLWKDHTAAEEAAAITETARRCAPEYLSPIGGTYSSEWFWSKIWHCRRVAPDVFDAAASWVELADFVPSVLGGVTSPGDIVRGVCAAGHKAMYSEAWGGLPSREFLSTLDPALGRLRDRLYTKAHAAERPAGVLAREWAEAFGVRPGAVGQGRGRWHAGRPGEPPAPGAGASGLVALDWTSGNRTLLVDPRWRGLMVGRPRPPTRAEISRALVEAPAFGARAIIER